MAGNCWERDNPWFQGKIYHSSVFNGSDIALESDHEWIMCISHDCDIANNDLEIEPIVEFAYAKKIIDSIFNFENAKNVRTLHICTNNTDDEIWFEICVHNKFKVNKSALISAQITENLKSNKSYSLDADGLNTLRGWLAARYKRQALPDTFNNRTKKLFDDIEEKTKKSFKELIGIFINYDPRNEAEEDEPYEVDIFVVYSTAVEGAEEKAIALQDRLIKRYEDGNRLDGKVYLGSCKAISEAEFTFQQLRECVFYRYDYISYRFKEDDSNDSQF